MCPGYFGKIFAEIFDSYRSSCGASNVRISAQYYYRPYEHRSFDISIHDVHLICDFDMASKVRGFIGCLGQRHRVAPYFLFER
jgi:hypothetical protein